MTVPQSARRYHGGDVFVLDDMLAVLIDLAAASIAGVPSKTERAEIVHRLVQAMIDNIETRAATRDFIETAARQRTVQ